MNPQTTVTGSATRPKPAPAEDNLVKDPVQNKINPGIGLGDIRKLLGK